MAGPTAHPAGELGAVALSLVLVSVLLLRKDNSLKPVILYIP